LNLANLHRIYFLGIGGIGMSALARYFVLKGAEVYGYDKTPSTLTTKLEEEGIKIHYTDDVKAIPPSVDLVVYTPAVPRENAEYIHFWDTGIPMLKRAEVLGLITSSFQTIAIAGTHGKTTITTMSAHLLYQSKSGCSAFLGGISKNYNNNLLYNGRSKYVVVEADEFDRSFLQLHPQTAVITSVDADHLDIYGNKESLNESFHMFASQVKKDGNLIIQHNLIADLKNLNPGCRLFTYGVECEADFVARNISLNQGYYSFNLEYPQGQIKNLKLGLQGYYNLENSVAAIATALLNGVSEDEICRSLPVFTGVMRRFDVQINVPGFAYIDDYAHHPAELKACISSVRRLFPDRRITGIFQPHLFTRTRDFADEFARSLELLDELILMEIYPARELSVPGITSSWLLEKVNLDDKCLMTSEEILEHLRRNSPDVLITMGAGDIDLLVKPIRQIFTKQIEKSRD
jgi:UDP-N-acetylmuramate--alanine ligase